MRFLTASLIACTMFPSTASAAAILCSDPSVNHMLVDSSYVSDCLASGIGPLGPAPTTDGFLTGAGSAFSFVGFAAFDQNGDLGSFSFQQSTWDAYKTLAVGFKFGTGNNRDEWFVYELNALVSAGLWEFVNVFDSGGGLSHVNVYGILKDEGGSGGTGGSGGGGGSVPEPGGLALVGIALVAAALARRRALPQA